MKIVVDVVLNWMDVSVLPWVIGQGQPWLSYDVTALRLVF